MLHTPLPNIAVACIYRVSWLEAVDECACGAQPHRRICNSTVHRLPPYSLARVYCVQHKHSGLQSNNHNCSFLSPDSKLLKWLLPQMLRKRSLSANPLPTNGFYGINLFILRIQHMSVIFLSLSSSLSYL